MTSRRFWGVLHRICSCCCRRPLRSRHPAAITAAAAAADAITDAAAVVGAVSAAVAPTVIIIIVVRPRTRVEGRKRNVTPTILYTYTQRSVCRRRDCDDRGLTAATRSLARMISRQNVSRKTTDHVGDRVSFIPE